MLAERWLIAGLVTYLAVLSLTATPAVAAPVASSRADHRPIPPPRRMSDASVSRCSSPVPCGIPATLPIKPSATVVERLARSPNDAVRNVVEIAFLEDGVLLGGGREHAALASLVPRFGLATRALLAETKRHYDALVEASRREP
jgi:hypothetical protein